MGALAISTYTRYKYIQFEGVRSCSSYGLPYTLFFTYTRYMDINARGKIKVMTQATMHSHSVLEDIIYQLQSKGAIVDPCIVDDLITCIKTHTKFEFK